MFELFNIEVLRNVALLVLVVAQISKCVCCCKASLAQAKLTETRQKLIEKKR